MTTRRLVLQKMVFITAATFSLGMFSAQAMAASAEYLDQDAARALQSPYKSNPAAESLPNNAKGDVAEFLA